MQLFINIPHNTTWRHKVAIMQSVIAVVML